MYKTTEARNGECNGHARTTAPKKPAARPKLPSPPCPDCGDRYNIFSQIDKPDNLVCLACDGIFTVKDVKKLVREWTDFLNNQSGE